MTKLTVVQSEIEEIKMRNKRVELDKAWETSWTRRVTIITLTYLIISLVFIIIKVDRPLVNSIIPTIGYFLSTLSVPFIKDFWIKKHQS